MKYILYRINLPSSIYQLNICPKIGKTNKNLFYTFYRLKARSLDKIQPTVVLGSETKNMLNPQNEYLRIDLTFEKILGDTKDNYFDVISLFSQNLIGTI